MSTLTPVPLERLERLVARVTGVEAPLSATEMPGGASTRRFFRVELADGRRAVAMYVPEAGKPDEIAKVAEHGRRWPFLEVRDLLHEHGVRVPTLIGEATADGFILVEDLGDDTLARYLEREPARRESVYRIAVADLARAQKRLGPVPAGSIVKERAFDRDLLRWEIDHFREWALEARGVSLSDEDGAVFSQAAEWLANTVAALPRGFVHRDYQSRNLMVLPRAAGEDESIAWIDFQDALLGPRVYDLVALLGDSYQTFDDAFVSARLDEFAAHHGLGPAARAELGREFDLVTVQRKLKDAGRFVFILHKKGDGGYLKFVEPTISKVRRALGRLRGAPHLDALAALLERLYGPLVD